MIETGEGFVPRALGVQVILQPADELHAALSEALQAGVDKAQAPGSALLGLPVALGVALGLTAKFALVAHWALLFDEPLHEQHEGMRQAEQTCLAALGYGSAAPSFGLMELVLELIEDFLDIPARFVEQGNDLGGQV
ncbi:MAG TPA: hypothetical protein VMN36_12360 [Verrucomicrobiales bacterium]|nr:hypothetical protein [Verrucomicrobiales bacterium]